MTPQPDPLLDVMNRIASWIPLFSGRYLNPTGNDDEVANKDVGDCRRQLTSHFESGATEATIVAYEQRRYSLGEIRAACDKVEILAKEWGVRNRKAAADQLVALDAPFLAAKLTDDKLDLAQHVTYLYGIGGVVLTPAQLKKAKIAFKLEFRSDDDWLLYRYVFHGDHLVSTTNEGFLRQPGPSKFR